MKFILLATLAIASTASFAKTLTCPVFLIEASSRDMDESTLGKNMVELTVSLDKQGNSTDDGKAVFTSSAGELIEIYSLVNTDSKIKELRQLDLAVFVNGKRDSIRSLILREDGVSTGTGWHLGPKGATQLKMMASSSLSEKALDMRLNYDVYNILKAKYKVQSSQIDNEAYSISQIAKKAVSAGNIKEGIALGTAIFFGCWQQK